MKDIYQTLRALSAKPTSEPILMETMPDAYWNGLPFYASLYIRTPYEMITDMEGLIEFVQYFLLEHSLSTNPFKRSAIEAVVFPLYNSLTGRNYNSELLTAFGLNQRP